MASARSASEEPRRCSIAMLKEKNLVLRADSRKTVHGQFSQFIYQFNFTIGRSGENEPTIQVLIV